MTDRLELDLKIVADDVESLKAALRHICRESDYLVLDRQNAGGLHNNYTYGLHIGAYEPPSQDEVKRLEETLSDAGIRPERP